MIKIETMFNLRIFCSILIITLLFSNVLYSAEALRVPLRGAVLIQEELLRKTARDSKKEVVFESMDQMLRGLEQQLPDKLKKIGLSERDVGIAKQCMDLVSKMYKNMDLLTKNYHNHVHNLGVTYAMLLLTEGFDVTEEDIKTVFIAALFHDFHCRISIDPGTGNGTPAFVEETLRQLSDILEIEAYPGAAVDDARYAGKGSIINDETKKALKKAIQEFLGGEEKTKKLFDYITVMIRRTDFASGIQPQESYKQLAYEIRRMMDVKIGQYQSIQDVIDIAASEYRKVYSKLESDKAISGQNRENTEKWLERQKGIEISYLRALKKIGTTEKRLLFHEFANRLERGADQAGFYFLCSSAMVEGEVTKGLHVEIPAVTAPGAYPFFFNTNLLVPEVLKALGTLPDTYKDNFCRVMRYYSSLSRKAGEVMPDSVPVRPLFLDAEDDWNKKFAKVAYILGISVAILKESLLGGFLSEADIGRLISEARIRMYEPNTIILRKGERPGETGVYEILSGEASVVIDGRVIAILHKGDVFGEIAVVKQTIRTATVVVSNGESIIAEIPPVTFLDFYHNNSSLRNFVDGLIERRLGLNHATISPKRETQSGL